MPTLHSQILFVSESRLAACSGAILVKKRSRSYADEQNCLDVVASQFVAEREFENGV